MIEDHNRKGPIQGGTWKYSRQHAVQTLHDKPLHNFMLESRIENNLIDRKLQKLFPPKTGGGE